MNRGLLFLPFAVFVAITVVFWVGLGIEDKSSLPSPLIGQPFPEFELGVVEDGRILTTTDLEGKPALVNVWATWCPTCKAEHAFLNALSDEDIRIIGINYKDDLDKARQWLADYGNPYAYNLSDPDGSLGIELGVYGAPETFLIDSTGVIRAKHIGDLNPVVWETLGETFRGLK
ncbi:MAG: DsbE family thiol:disulfide interchange protein [Thalassolituus sp.]|jgi:cytochrome c biogenesis protein CcmG/thiol:disulfide interchange protein DsbE|nr:MAG: DsbE family thiol:disulfide interchange protein [Thalassolituus sp.]|tara:strand:+ start:546 stop:1067 length:522 start_codon:yes stop_codon:yes gene_type:complete